MNRRRNFAAGLAGALGLALAAGGQPPAVPPPGPLEPAPTAGLYVGAPSCASSNCHGSTRPRRVFEDERAGEGAVPSHQGPGEPPIHQLGRGRTVERLLDQRARSHDHSMSAHLARHSTSRPLANSGCRPQDQPAIRRCLHHGAGLGLSGVAMLWAAAGQLTPVAGALVQEGIDLLVILNALRASLPGRRSG